MAVEYDFYESPIPEKGEKEVRYHARPVSSETVTTDELSHIIHSRCTATAADVKAVLSALSEVVLNKLMDGKRICIDGLGYFQITLQCPSVGTTTELHGQSVSFKSVSFRPEQSLKDELKLISCVRSKVKRHSKVCSEIEIDMKLSEFFKGNEYMFREDFERICNMVRSTAQRRINLLLSAGKLIKKGSPRSPFYCPAPGYYGKTVM